MLDEGPEKRKVEGPARVVSPSKGDESESSMEDDVVVPSTSSTIPSSLPSSVLPLLEHIRVHGSAFLFPPL